MILHHVLDLQILDGYHLVFVDKPCRKFVQEILADIGDMLMDTGNTDTRLVSVVGFRHFTGKSPLFADQLSCQMLQYAGIRNGVAVAVRAKLL